MFSLLFRKKNSIIDHFAHNLAAEFYSRISTEQVTEYFSPIEASSNLKKADKSQAKRDQITMIFNEVILQVQQFKTIHKLGIYGKARLHLIFTERLKDLGYPPAIAAEVNKTILIRTP